MLRQKIRDCFLLMLLAAFVPALAQRAPVSKVKKATTSQREAAPDQALFEKFELVCKQMANVKGNYTLGGVMNIVDRANPAEKMENVKFLFCKQGDDFYYKLGTTATINRDGFYLYIDNQSKRIIISPKKQVEYDQGLKQFGDMGANIRSENYKLVSKVTGDIQTISLINEHHISCKEYSISFNKRDMKIKRLYMRLSNLNDPLHTDNEKIVDVSISKWDNTADIAKYAPQNNIIKNENGKWKTVNEFKNYQLINM